MRARTPRWGTALVLGIVAAAAACSNGVKTMNDNLPICTTLTDCLSHDGERVQVVATYTVWDPLPVRAANQSPARQVMLRFSPDQDGPFLDAWGYPGHMRPLDEIARFGGKKVRVTGTFLRKMPPHPVDPPEAASLDGPCIHPIDSITLAE
jgi:hypothetical protein